MQPLFFEDADVNHQADGTTTIVLKERASDRDGTMVAVGTLRCQTHAARKLAGLIVNASEERH
jgi:hypothetical protein